MKKTNILVSSLLFILTSCAGQFKQNLGSLLPELLENEFSLVKHTIGCNSLAPLAIIDHYYNDDLAAITKFVSELEKTNLKKYKKLPDDKNVACPQINTYSFSNHETKFSFEIVNMFLVKDDLYYELEELPAIAATRTSHSFSGSTTILEVLDDNGGEVTELSIPLPLIEFEKITGFSERDVQFTIETHGGIISIYDAVTFGLDVGEQTEQFYKVINDNTFANLFNGDSK